MPRCGDNSCLSAEALQACASGVLCLRVLRLLREGDGRCRKNSKTNNRKAYGDVKPNAHVMLYPAFDSRLSPVGLTRADGDVT